MPKPLISHEEGMAAVTAWRSDPAVPRPVLATAVRYTAQLLAERAPGSSVEVRIPPFAAVQCLPGPGHSRGTPPNVVEMDPATWLALATGAIRWRDALDAARVRASGTRADLEPLLPLVRPGCPRG